MTEDSLRMAFAMAESMDFAMGAEKRSNAQIEALLDYSFNGVVNMDRNGVITTVNPVMRDILGPEGEQIIGRRMEQVFQDIDQGKLVRVLEGGMKAIPPLCRLTAPLCLPSLPLSGWGMRWKAPSLPVTR